MNLNKIQIIYGDDEGKMGYIPFSWLQKNQVA